MRPRTLHGIRRRWCVGTGSGRAVGAVLGLVCRVRVPRADRACCLRVGLGTARELHRLKRERLRANGAGLTGDAEACFRRALAVAQQQGTRFWELRSATRRALQSHWVIHARNHPMTNATSISVPDARSTDPFSPLSRLSHVVIINGDLISPLLSTGDASRSDEPASAGAADNLRDLVRDGPCKADQAHSAIPNRRRS